MNKKSKSYFQKYLNRAFWNSLLAVSSALLVVLIVVYGWQTFLLVKDSRIMEEITGDAEENLSEDDIFALLESLKDSENTISLEEQERLLQELAASTTEVMTKEEKIDLLESLNQ